MKITLFGHRIAVTELGIESGDLLWIYPWKRVSKNVWISFSFDASYPSFKEYQKEWDMYVRHCWKSSRYKGETLE